MLLFLSWDEGGRSDDKRIIARCGGLSTGAGLNNPASKKINV
jgi:hypothetical protein